MAGLQICVIFVSKIQEKMNINVKLEKWQNAQKRHRLSDKHVQMARELGLNPDKLGKIDNHKQETWKAPLPQFIEEIYYKRFKRTEPTHVKSVKELMTDEKSKKELKKIAKQEKRKMINSQIQTCLWFDNCAKEAVEFYCKVFKNGKILSENPIAIEFEVNNTKFVAINGSDMYKPTEAVSLVVYCATQEEINYYWDSLTKDGGEENFCGWLKDKYGFSWQIIPFNISELLRKPEVSDELLKMKKIDMEVLEKYVK
jgi:predicted 3-demethylubiquinone-9 3-methyltransferase (glyoxalase superfamily)